MGIFLHIDRLDFNYHGLQGETPALRNVSLKIEEEEFVAIVGPSGCGKTTLLSLIAGLEKPDHGTIVIKNPEEPIGYMLQKDELFEWRSTWDNIMLGLEIRGRIQPEHIEKAKNLLRTYGLYDFRKNRPSGLSGGMRQRAALIRTLMLEPELLLLDEPFSALDYQTRLLVSDDIWRIIKEQKKTAILITHDISEAISMADRVVVLSRRPGTVVKDIPIRFESLTARTPFATRNAVEFHDYFQQIWEELNRHEKEG